MKYRLIVVMVAIGCQLALTALAENLLGSGGRAEAQPPADKATGNRPAASQPANEGEELYAAIMKASALQEKGDYPAAARACERGLDLARRLYGPDHEGTAELMTLLAASYLAMDQYAKAEPLLERSVKIIESKLGPDHLNLAAPCRSWQICM